MVNTQSGDTSNIVFLIKTFTKSYFESDYLWKYNTHHFLSLGE